MICNLVLQTTCTIDFQHTCTCRKQLLLRGRARIGRAGASGPRASTSFWLLVRVVHLSLHENCVNACGVCKKALYPANLAWLISLSQRLVGPFFTLSPILRLQACISHEPAEPSIQVRGVWKVDACDRTVWRACALSHHVRLQACIS
jgi:hypothetical protein